MIENGGLIFNDSVHYIDHLAPFCALQQWPLIVVESGIAELCRALYPELEVIETNLWDIPFPKRLVSCYPAKLLRSAFPFMPASTQFLWLPHGNSDKGWKSPYFEALSEETALIYGKKMEDFLTSKNRLIPTISIGNFRLTYWHKHRAFYDATIAQIIPLAPSAKWHLYAPTWDDRDNNCSFWESFSALASSLPTDCALIVKVHPNTEKNNLSLLEQIKGKWASHPNILFLGPFPPIYPLLDKCHAYIGDMSSIGYDFLYWNRPMYFINHKKSDRNTDPSLFLYRCGFDILPEELPSIFFKNDLPKLQTIRKEIYAYTFDCSSLHRI